MAVVPESCPACGSDVLWESCEICGGDGLDGHDCGEDCCVCAYPEENVRCETCDGEGGWIRCLRCGILPEAACGP